MEHREALVALRAHDYATAAAVYNGALQDAKTAALRETLAYQGIISEIRAGNLTEAARLIDAHTALPEADTQRLWRAELTRGELEVALELLGSRPPGTGAVGFSEELRRYYSGGPQVQPTCSRTPNVCAVVLVDLGLLTA